MTSETKAPFYTPGGFREVLAISVPLILSTSSTSLMFVVDRIFLSWYSKDALAASLPAGATAWAFLCMFIGATGYVSTFVSQYDGAGRQDRIGAAIWQGFYFSCIASVFCALTYFLAEPIFNLADHPKAIRENEILCFRVIVLGAGGFIFSAALSAFYSGRGKTWTVMWVNIAGALINGVLDYLMIFGYGGFPEWGLFGAALASVIAPYVMTLIYIVLLVLPENRQRFQTLSSWRFDRDLFLRLIRFGLPSGLQFTMDVTAFTTFILLVGRLGELELAASNIAFAINHLLFMPMLGLAMGTSVLVGRYLGAEQPDHAAKSTWTSIWITTTYMTLFSLALIIWPDEFILIFDPGNWEGNFAEVIQMTRILLYFVAAYSVLDGWNIVFSSALKGAGDTRFVFLTALTAAAITLIAPVYLACIVYGRGVYTAWFFLFVWLLFLATVYFLRFLAGKWRSMRVIEHAPAPGAVVEEGPLVEV
ncbi:MAG: MATE family efflux transporter [Candidatus Omnitrophica bacterium]|nr:MATE family efflux transporter [Candidatus Omnitrophota bacterium]MCB9768370.1 MATE family efflux transporter [Candidatus Omnitrophota bacterium]MCB9783137.1 MATE family efflux transporter [Candidatus Omnitrophota bacterium]